MTGNRTSFDKSTAEEKTPKWAKALESKLDSIDSTMQSIDSKVQSLDSKMIGLAGLMVGVLTFGFTVITHVTGEHIILQRSMV